MIITQKMQRLNWACRFYQNKRENFLKQTMTFFYKFEKKVETTPLTKLDRISIAVDTSGSTSGAILREERESAKLFASLFSLHSGTQKKNFQFLRWNSIVSDLRSLDDLLHSSGGTSPSVIVSNIAAYKASLLILYTDGECDEAECKLLNKQMADFGVKIPIIVVFTLKSSLHHPSTTVKQIEQQVNMSIPNGLMTICADVCIVVNVNAQEHRLLMASGAFAKAFRPIALENSTKLRELPVFEFPLLANVQIMEQGFLPPGCIMLNGFAEPIILHKLYEAMISCEQVSAELITALSDRMILPKVDLDRVHDSSVRFLSSNAYESDPEYKNLMEKLMRVAVSSNKSEEHITCRQQLEVLKSRYKRADSLESKAKRAAIQNLLQVIADYRANSNQFVLGSNRANRAAVIGVSDAQKLREQLTTLADNILQIHECPIFMEPGNACILLTTSMHNAPPSIREDAVCPAPAASACNTSSSSSSSYSSASKVSQPESVTKTDADMFLRFTSDFTINSPFHLGATAMIVTKGVFSAQFGLDCATNPLTRQHVCARIVLVKDIHSLMRQLCRAFCASRQMWHMVLAFAAMLAKHLLEDEWAEHAILLPYFQWLIDAIRTTRDFSDDSLLQPDVAQTQRVSLRQAIEFVMGDYAVHLRNRLPSDSRALLNIPVAIATLTDDDGLASLQAKVAKIGGMLSSMEIFAKLLDEYKKGNDTLEFVMELDPIYKHCISVRKGLAAVIGMIFLRDDIQKQGKIRQYRNLAFQDALNLALIKSKESKDPNVSAFYRAFQGENIDDVVPITLPIAPTNNMHFGEENFERTKFENGKHYVVCAYCGFQRQVDPNWERSSPQDQQARSDMREHFLRSFTPDFFYNGYRYVKEACAELGIDAPEEKIFICAKKKLYAKHGASFWCLHTQDTKNQLLYFIRTRKWEANPNGPKPNKV